MTSTSEPKAFQICLKILEFEHENTSNSLQLMLQEMNQLPKILHELNDIDLFKLFPILLKIISRIFSNSLSIEKSQILHLKRVVSCADIEVELLELIQKCRSTSTSQVNVLPKANNFSLNNQPRISNLYDSNLALLNKLVLVNTACLEALKISNSSTTSSPQYDPKVNADVEYLQSRILSFFKTVLSIWGDEVGSKPLQSLTGPFLAQLVQSSLFLSQHSTKTVALDSLELLTSLIKITSSCLIDLQTSSSMIETWKSFYPGIFSSLYVLCTTLHQRNTPILATSLNCILQLTWVVINDQHNSKLLNQIRSNQSDPYEALLHSASAHGGLPLISGISSSSENIFDKNIDVDSSLRWRVDLAQRIQKHLPLAFRHVWNSISPTFHRYQVLLLESLYRLICASVKFLGASLSAELCLVLVEASYHSLNFHVSDSITKYCLKLRQEIPSSEWIAMQSIFVQRFVEDVQNLGPLLPFQGGGGREDRISSLLCEILSSANLLPLPAIQTCMSILLSNSTTSSRRNHTSGISAVYLLFLPDLSTSSSNGTSSTCLLSPRRFFSPDYLLYFDSGYYRAPFLHMRFSGMSVESINTDISSASPGKNSIKGSQLMQYITVVFGSCELSLSALVDDWQKALSRLEIFFTKSNSLDSYKYYISRYQHHADTPNEEENEKDLGNTSSRNRVKLLLHSAISCTSLISSMIGYHETTKNTQHNQRRHCDVSCGFCQLKGVFIEKSKKILHSGIHMMRCSKCKNAYYCSKDHQQQHWSIHKKECVVREDSNSQSDEPDLEYSSPLSPQQVQQNRSLLEMVSSSLVKQIVRILRCYLSESPQNSSSSSQIGLLLDIFISGILELLGDISFLSAKAVADNLIEVMVPILSIAVQSSSSSPFQRSSERQVYSIVNQAALTTLSRISLNLSYKTGKEFLRANLDYLVDEMCYILQSIRRTNVSDAVAINHNERHLSSMNRIHDDRIIRVVGSVFLEIHESNTNSNGECDSENDAHVVMLLRDLVRDSLDVIDILCTSSTNYAEFNRQNIHQPHNLPSEYQRGQRLLGPLLGLMHSLILRTLTPVSRLPPRYQSSLSIRAHLFPYPFHSTSMPSAPKVVTNSSPDVTPNSIENPPLETVSRADMFLKEIKKFQQQINSSPSNLFEEMEKPGTEEEKNDDEEDESPNLHQRSFEMILNILDRSIYFLATYDVNAQILVIATMSTAFARLAHNRKLLLPAVHKIWPVIMNRLKEQKTLLLDYYSLSSDHNTLHEEPKTRRSAFLLPSLLDFVTLLAILCGDYLSLKLKEDFLPEVSIILHAISNDSLMMMKRTQIHQQTIHTAPLLLSTDRNENSTRISDGNQMMITRNNYSQYSLSNKIIIALLDCLSHLCQLNYEWSDTRTLRSQHYQFHHQLVNSNPLTEIVSIISLLILPLLSHMQCAVVQEKTVHLLKFLQRLNPIIINALGEVITTLSSHGSQSVDPSLKERCDSLWFGLVTHPSLIDSFQRFQNQIPLKLNPTHTPLLPASINSSNGPSNQLMKAVSSRKKSREGQTSENLGWTIIPKDQEILSLIISDRSIAAKIQTIIQ